MKRIIAICMIACMGILSVQATTLDYKSSLVYQPSTGVYSTTNCVPSSIKITLNLLGIKSEPVHDIRMRIWYDSYGCLLYDAMKYIESYDVETDWNYIDNEDDIKSKLDEWYAIVIVSENGYNHCVVVVDYVNGNYVILDPLRLDVITISEIGVIEEFVIYIKKNSSY